MTLAILVALIIIGVLWARYTAGKRGAPMRITNQVPVQRDPLAPRFGHRGPVKWKGPR